MNINIADLEINRIMSVFYFIFNRIPAGPIICSRNEGVLGRLIARALVTAVIGLGYSLFVYIGE